MQPRASMMQRQMDLKRQNGTMTSGSRLAYSQCRTPHGRQLCSGGRPGSHLQVHRPHGRSQTDTSRIIRASAALQETDGETDASRKSSHAAAGVSGRAGAPTKPSSLADSSQDVPDKLIAVFSEKTPAEWRKLIAFSKQWASLADSVFERLDQRMAEETDVSEKSKLRKLARRLRTVHQELEEYNELILDFRERDSSEWEGLVAAYRSVLTSDMFSHIENLIRAAHKEPAEQEELAALATKLLALVTAYDEVSSNEQAMQDATMEFHGLLQVDSLEEADRKIDDLAASGKLNPAMLLTMAKAYAAAKETDMTKEEVKDIMAHLYFKAKESFAKMQPPEIRILKHLLSMDDPQQLSQELRNAFEPGPQLETEQQDFLSTTPERLMSAVEMVLTAYEKSAGGESMLGQAGALMNPEVITRMKQLQTAIRKDFM